MKWTMTAMVVASLLATTQAVGGDASADDLKKLQGTWKIVDVESKKEVGFAQVTMVVSGNKMTMYEKKEKLMEVTFKLDATKKPKHIDILPKEKDKKDLGLGIYELDGDTWRICVGSTQERDFNGKKEFVPSKRPMDFSGKEESVLVFKRVK